jgi:integrase
MRMKLNDAAIRALAAPSSGRLEVFDTERLGLALRVSGPSRKHPAGCKTWALVWHREGRVRRMKLGEYPVIGLSAARERARDELGKVARGNDPLRERAVAREATRAAERAAQQAFTVGDLAAEYLKRHAIKKKSGHIDKLMLDRDVLPRWGTMKAADVTRGHVRQLLDDVVDRGAKVQANRVLALVRKMFNFGLQRDLVEHNPCLGIARPTTERPCERVLSAEELRALWQALGSEDAGTAGIVKLCLWTAARGGEVKAMRREDVRLEDALWSIPGERSKNSRGRLVPLVAEAVEMLRAQLASHEGEHVFPSQGTASTTRTPHRKSLQKAMRRLRKRAGLTDFALHSARRTVATHMAAIGVDRWTIARLLGHADATVTGKVYERHDRQPEVRQAVEKWSRRLNQIVTGEGAAKVIPLRA